MYTGICRGRETPKQILGSTANQSLLMFAVPRRVDRRRSIPCAGVSPANNQRAFLWVKFMAGRGLIYGVGKNDADYPVNRFILIDGKNKRVWICPMYLTWRNMLMRCYSEGCQIKHPTYAGCSVVDDWLLFSNFKLWMESQEWQGMELDKDIIHPGNKVYGPEFCIFVPSQLNAFLTDHGAARGQYPIGVSIERKCGRFKASCSNPFTGRLENLGRFHRPEDAHLAWKARKNQHARRYADMQKDIRVAQALRDRYMPTKEHN